MNLDNIRHTWDVIVVGGGITGAGVLHEAARAGLKVLLLEQNDFAWGTSSRSSKLVHGGLRYLKQGRLLLTYASVRERERLLRQAPGLIDPIGFYTPVYKNHSPGRKTLSVGLSIYSLMAGTRQNRNYAAAEFSRRMPHINRQGLQVGFEFFDAQVDDARLVLRVIQEGIAAGGQALNYTRVLEIERTANGTVAGVLAQDKQTGKHRSLRAPVVINATGVFAETLQPSPDKALHIRPLRGSHLIFPFWALPISQAVSFTHPADRRPVFIIPWEGVVLIGTTDVDHGTDLSREPSITTAEAHYLMEGVQTFFPGLRPALGDCLATMAGIRPVLSKGTHLTPSQESREHIVWIEKGLVTVTGGKLTTFRRLAWDALRAARPFLGGVRFKRKDKAVFDTLPSPVPPEARVSARTRRRLWGRYGRLTGEMLKTARPEDLKQVSGTPIVWAEFAHAARHEMVRSLPDLLLRRVRLGLLCPRGGEEHLDRIEQLCGDALPWDKQRWQAEKENYRHHWRRYYHLPAPPPSPR
jgi:glycerol-3-phosphate dehydrogenase